MMFEVQISEQADRDLRDMIVTVMRVMYGGRDVDKELKRHTHDED
jgi:hypothetical protein